MKTNAITRPDRVIRQFLRRLRVRLTPGGARVLEVYDQVVGQIMMREAGHLYHLAHGRRVIVEIGSYRGRSTCILALGSEGVGGIVHAIDPHIDSSGHAEGTYIAGDHEQLLENARRFGVSDRIRPVVLRSDEARRGWDGTQIDLLWIDGDHSYEAVSADLGDWSGLVRPGGIICGHDYSDSWPGTKRAWDEFFARSPGFTRRPGVKTIVWGVRQE
jgi:predicted O-methyltransferase YrrM